MDLYEALQMIDHGETPEQYNKRMQKIRKYSRERDFLEDQIKMLDDEVKIAAKTIRLEKVNRILKDLA